MESQTSLNYLESNPVEIATLGPKVVETRGKTAVSMESFSRIQANASWTCETHGIGDFDQANRSAAAVPLVELVGTRLFFEGHIIDFGRQNLMVKLFRAFLERPQCRVSRLDLIKQIYGHHNLTISNRRVLSDFHNIVKLISRARKICEQNFANGDERTWVWFDYDPFAFEWVLLKPRHVRMSLAQD